MDKPNQNQNQNSIIYNAPSVSNLTKDNLNDEEEYNYLIDTVNKHNTPLLDKLDNNNLANLANLDQSNPSINTGQLDVTHSVNMMPFESNKDSFNQIQHKNSRLNNYSVQTISTPVEINNKEKYYIDYITRLEKQLQTQSSQISTLSMQNINKMNQSEIINHPNTALNRVNIRPNFNYSQSANKTRENDAENRPSPHLMTMGEEDNYVETLKKALESELINNGVLSRYITPEGFIDFLRLRSECDDYRKQLVLAQSMVNSLKFDLEDAAKENEILQKKVENLSKILEEKAGEKVKDALILELKGKNEEVVATLKETREEAERIRGELNQKDAKISELTKLSESIEIYKQNYESINKDFENLMKEKHALTKTNGELKEKVTELLINVLSQI